MPQGRPRIAGLEWDDRNEAHIERHINAWLIEEMIESGDWYAFPNTSGHPPEHVKIIGRTPSGLYVTTILRSPTSDNLGMWRPITGWMAEGHERDRYLRERRKGKN